MPESPVLDLALRLWPDLRDGQPVADAGALDELLSAVGQPGAPERDCGLTATFACFSPDEEAEVVLPSGERSSSDAEARFLGHLLVTRTLLAAGLLIDERVVQALSAAHALSWTTEGGVSYHQTPLALAVSFWLVALDLQSDSDRPLPIDWSAACFERDWWDPDYRLFSHYDVRERALDWAAYVSIDPGAARRLLGLDHRRAAAPPRGGQSRADGAAAARGPRRDGERDAGGRGEPRAGPGRAAGPGLPGVVAAGLGRRRAARGHLIASSRRRRGPRADARRRGRAPRSPRVC